MKVKLTYFKLSSGKFYSDGELEIADDENIPMFLIHQKVATLIRQKRLPGLVSGHSDYIVSVDASEHPNNYPKLFLPGL